MNDLLQRFENGDVRALAQLITKVENRSDDSLAILKKIFPKSGKARIIGVTGSPGSGKSTLVDKLALYYRQTGESLGIVAVDPTSPYTGGAILGDRIRMQAIETDPQVFIRSMATRGQLGGLAATTTEVVTVLDASGKNPVIVETVGVGQDEIDIVKLADVSIVILVPGMGDDIQALKAGIMEIADIFVINKCDRPGAEKVERAIQAMLALSPKLDDGWEPPIVRVTATEGAGIEELSQSIAECHNFFQNQTVESERRRESTRNRLVKLMQDRIVSNVLENAFPGDDLEEIIDAISRREKDPYSVVEELIDRLNFDSREESRS